MLVAYIFVLFRLEPVFMTHPAKVLHAVSLDREFEPWPVCSGDGRSLVVGCGHKLKAVEIFHKEFTQFLARL